MAEIFRFFDSTEQDPRQYPAEHFAEYFRGIIMDGIQHENEDGLKVIANGINMTIAVQPGAAFVQGYQYILDAEKELTLANPDASNRIDRVVLQLNRNPDKREIKAILKKGTPSQTPAPPTLVRDAYIYEYPLAQIFVVAGQSFIKQEQITPEAENAKILNSKYRQIFVASTDPDNNVGGEGDIWIKYKP